MRFIFVPSIAFISRVKKAGVELAPETPTVTSCVVRSATRTYRHRVPDEDHGSLRARRAEPIELDGVVACLLRAEQRLKWRVVLNKANHAAVPLGIVVEKIGGRDPASTWHVSDDKRRIAGYMPAYVPRDHARERVVAASGASTH